jgi:hypothetical protein
MLDDENPLHSPHENVIENGSNHDTQRKISFKQKL